MAKQPIWTITPHQLDEIIHDLKKNMTEHYEMEKRHKAEYKTLQAQIGKTIDKLHSVVLKQMENNNEKA